jgi:hypothetical protein
MREYEQVEPVWNVESNWTLLASGGMFVFLPYQFSIPSVVPG